MINTTIVVECDYMDCFNRLEGRFGRVWFRSMTEVNTAKCDNDWTFMPGQEAYCPNH